MVSEKRDDTMNDGDWHAERFEEHRGRLRAIAYRMLGRRATPTTPYRRPGSASAVRTRTRWTTSVPG
jgi:hypothetical protein